VAKKKKIEKPKEYTRRQLSHFQRQKRRQRIILLSGIGIIAAVILIILIGWFIGEYRPMHRTVIKINETEFKASYYIELLKMVGAGSPGQDLDAITSTMINNIIENELVRQEAETLGIIVSDEEVKQALEEEGTPVNDVTIGLTRSQKLQTRLRDEHFSAQVPVSDNQVNVMAMLVESESVAAEIRDKVVNGDNFTALAKQYGQNYYSKNAPFGDFGWHPAEVLQSRFDTLIPIDYAFSAEAGDVSPPLSDNESYKQLGYWLINVLGISTEDDAEVQALYLSNQQEAFDIKARLESGDNISALAEQYSQYTPSKENGGKLEPIARPTGNATTISEVFDGYIFNPATEFGKWSDPVKDTDYWTRGGAWVVKVVDKDDNRELSTEDRTYLINNTYSDWVKQLPLKHATEIDISGLTEEVRVWMVEQAKTALQGAAGG